MISDLIAVEEYPLLSGYRKVSEYATGFETGEQPDWLYNSTFGDGSITYETTGGGRARINTGTTSTGDGGELKVGVAGSAGTPLQLDNYDALLLETTSAAADPDSTFDQHQLAFYGDGDNSIVLQRHNDRVETTAAGGINNYPTPQKDHTAVPIRETIIWDIKNEELRSLVGGMMSQPINYVDVPEPSATDYLVIPHSVKSDDTTSDREAYLYDMRLALYES